MCAATCYFLPREFHAAEVLEVRSNAGVLLLGVLLLINFLAVFFDDAVAHSDLQLNIRPPGANCATHFRNWYFPIRAEEQNADVMASLNELLKVSHCCLVFVPLA